MKLKVFSGIKPTGALQLGNYLGAVKYWVNSQDERENIFCLVDLHAITIQQDQKTLKARTRELGALLIALGLDPQKSTLFVQSHIPAHTELAWIINCFTPMGWLKRMTQFKEKSDQLKEQVSAGLFDYPALMAADILLYDTDVVPVGEDQTQHVELTRDIAKRINSIYGEILKVPKVETPAFGARIMALDDTESKMSKSSEQPNGVIDLLDAPDVIKKKIMAATTDSQKEIVFNQNRPGIYNLLTIYQAITEQKPEQIEKEFQGKGYADFKTALAEVIINKLKPVQARYYEIAQDPRFLDSIFRTSLDKLEPIAQNTLNRLKEAIGLG